MTTFPQAGAGVVLTLLGGVSLAVSLYFHLPMWEVELTPKKPSAGGGEHLVAILFGLPALLVAILFNVITISKHAWKSRLAIGFLVVEILMAMTWVFLFVKDQLD